MMIIYKITNLINGKIYIGQTVRKLSTRISNHKCYNGSLISNAFKKYGDENFSIEIIDRASSKNELDTKEIYWIERYNSIAPNGYNITKGGGGTIGYKLSDETKQKISKANKGKVSPTKGYKLSDETKQKIRSSRKGKYCGENNPHYGKKHSEKTLKMLSELKKGKRLTNEQRKAISEGHKGKKMSDMQKKKISQAMPTKKKVINVDTGEIFESLMQASEMYNIDKSTLCKVCSGKRKKAGGFRWIYY